MSEFKHYSVMLNECISALDIKPDGKYVDCTLGGGGHSEEIVKRLTSGRLIAIDQDEDALAAAKQRLEEYADKITFVHNNFSNLNDILSELNIDEIDGVMYDLGVSSYQLDNAERGFSYNSDAPLDMRMDRSAGLTAYDVVNNYSEEELRRILFEYGEENNSFKIARAICEQRNNHPINTTFELSDIVKSVAKKQDLYEGHHPAKRTFQAIRIEVNGELNVIAPSIEAAVSHLKPGGRIVVLTFHSLEDRAVKQLFSRLEKGCTCPPSFPICVCGKKPQLKLVNKKPLAPSPQELLINRRSHSAKMRAAEKI
jgi:16S rRNA (cytosine1402-N4)-methyltransferase